MKCRNLILTAALFATCSLSVRAQGLYITEVNPSGSGSGHGYTADWFELTNTTGSAINISGWKIDDNSNSFASSVALRGVTSIGAGQSIVFFEGLADASTDTTITSAFNSAWSTSFVFGTSIGAYGGSGVGLSQTADAVNIYNSSGVLQANVSFGAASTLFTFDNSAKLNGAIAALSVGGTNGAYLSTGGETGSPGFAPIPEPSTYALILGFGALGFAALRRKFVFAS